VSSVEDKDVFERVHTMTNYWDGPRDGIANFHGNPHVYTSLFDHTRDEYSELFELCPVDEETLRLALEDWEIWLRWDDAYKAGVVGLSTHPVLPNERARHAEIEPVLAARLAALPRPSIRAKGVFRPTPSHTSADGGRWMEVQWTVSDDDHEARPNLAPR
jgi:hypothetical protein